MKQEHKLLEANLEFLGGVYRLRGQDQQLFVGQYQAASGYKSEEKIDEEAVHFYGLPKPQNKDKKFFFGGFSIHLPKIFKQLHYLSFFDKIKQKVLLFDAGITSVSEVVEIGSFLVEKGIEPIVRLKTYFASLIIALTSGRKFLVVGTFQIGSKYEENLKRICPNKLFLGWVTLKNGEKRRLIVLYNNRRDAIKRLLIVIYEEILKLFFKNKTAV